MRVLFPDWESDWLLYEDDELIAVDKPCFVPSQSADPLRADDVPTRLALHLQERDGREPYLGSHHRLDQATSGVLLYTKDKRANLRLAEAFAGRKVDKSYLAITRGWQGGDRSLHHVIVEQPGGLRRALPRGSRAHDGQEATTHVSVLERRGDLQLLRLRLETGRTHQARVQLAAAGAPLVGDAWYGGAPAERLMLHAEKLVVPHPRTARKLSLVAPRPAAFARCLDGITDAAAVYDDPVWLAEALRHAAAKRWYLGRPERHAEGRRTTAFRLVHGAADALPELTVDVYGDYAVAHFYGDDGVFADGGRRDRVEDALHACGFRGVYRVVRPKQANVLVDTRREELAPREPVRGEAAPKPLTVEEEGVRMAVELGDGLSTGVFLDQRQNRARLRDEAAGKRVLNLFAYTGLFGVAAALGGARETVNVDVSQVALERAQQNYELAGLEDLSAHHVIAEDVFVWLERAIKRGDRFDLIVCDPPAYSTTKKTRFSTASGDWSGLVGKVLQVLAPGGKVYAFSNHRKTLRGRFRRQLIEGARAAGVGLAQIKDLPDAVDHPAAFGEEAFLKGVLLVQGKASTRKPARDAEVAGKGAAGGARKNAFSSRGDRPARDGKPAGKGGRSAPRDGKPAAWGTPGKPSASAQGAGKPRKPRPTTGTRGPAGRPRGRP